MQFLIYDVPIQYNDLYILCSMFNFYSSIVCTTVILYTVYIIQYLYIIVLYYYSHDVLLHFIQNIILSRSNAYNVTLVLFLVGGIPRSSWEVGVGSIQSDQNKILYYIFIIYFYILYYEYKILIS